MKKTKKLLSLFLAVVMTFALFVPTLAAKEKTKLVVLGDSIAQGYGLGEGRNDWYKLCYGKQIADANGYEYVNHAIGGHTTYNLNSRLEEEKVIADVATADIIAVSIGGNNFLLSGIYQMAFEALALKKYDRIDNLIAEFCVDFGLIIDKIKAINPDAELFVQTLYNPRDDLLGQVYQYAVELYNAAVIRIADEKQGAYHIIDVYSAMEGHYEYFQKDKIHPNAAGHYVIANEYLRELKALGLGSADKLPTEMPEIEKQLTFLERIIEFIKKLFPFVF